ncbi:MAG: type II secretion system protein [Clostridia bacterium]
MKNLINQMKKRKGMTLIEIMVVLVIIAILSVAVFIGGNTYINKSRETSVREDFGSFEIAIQTMMLENNKYATNGIDGAHEDLVKLMNVYLADELHITGTSNSDTFSVKEDAWSNQYKVVFNADATNTEFKIHIISYGTDSITSQTAENIDENDLMMVVELEKGQITTAYTGFSEENFGDAEIVIDDFEAIAD